MSTIIRLSLTDTGLLRIRRLSAIHAILVARQLVSAYEAFEAGLILASARPLLAEKVELLRQGADALERQSPAPAAVAVVPTAEALAVEAAEVLGDRLLLDRAIERRLRRVDEATAPHVTEPEGDEVGDAARLVRDGLFRGGRRFTQLALGEQYQATRERLLALGEEGMAAAGVLRREKEVREVGILNAHLGRLLGITEAHAPVAAPEPLDPGLDLARGIVGYLGAVTAAWPLDNAEQNAARTVLLRGLLDELAD